MFLFTSVAGSLQEVKETPAKNKFNTKLVILPSKGSYSLTLSSPSVTVSLIEQF